MEVQNVAKFWIRLLFLEQLNRSDSPSLSPQSTCSPRLSLPFFPLPSRLKRHVLQFPKIIHAACCWGPVSTQPAARGLTGSPKVNRFCWRRVHAPSRVVFPRWRFFIFKDRRVPRISSGSGVDFTIGIKWTIKRSY